MNENEQIEKHLTKLKYLFIIHYNKYVDLKI